MRQQVNDTCPNQILYLCSCFQICLHNGPAITPDARDDVDYSWVEKNTSEYVRRYVMGVEEKPSITEHCIYTVSLFEGILCCQLSICSTTTYNDKNVLTLITAG